MKKICLFFVAMTCVLSVSAQSNDAYSTAVKKLMEITEVKSGLETTLSEMYAPMAPQMGISEAKARELGVFMANEMYSDMIELYVPIYKKYFTLAEIEELCELYTTPIGKKAAKLQSTIAAEAMQQAESLFPKLLPKVQQFLLENSGE